MTTIMQDIQKQDMKCTSADSSPFSTPEEKKDTYTEIGIYTHTHTYIYIYIHTHTHTHTHIYIYVLNNTF